MNLTELKEVLEATGLPVAYSFFMESENNPVPAPPFIVYFVTDSENFIADNLIYHQVQDVQIELYTDKKDLEAESKIEAVLTESELPFATVETFIESESLFQKIYEVRLF